MEKLLSDFNLWASLDIDSNSKRVLTMEILEKGVKYVQG